MVLVGAGGVPHEKLVELAEKHFSGLPTAPYNQAASAVAAAQKRKPDFVGSEVRIRDDTIPTANIAIAVEGVSWKDDDYFTALVTQAIVGNWDKAMGNAPHMGSKLSGFVHKNDLANSFMSFSTSYSDTGYAPCHLPPCSWLTNTASGVSTWSLTSLLVSMILSTSRSVNGHDSHTTSPRQRSNVPRLNSKHPSSYPSMVPPP
jgi:hypothetical protein